MSRGVSDKITYKPYNQGEQWLLPPSLDELVPQNHFVRIVITKLPKEKNITACVWPVWKKQRQNIKKTLEDSGISGLFIRALILGDIKNDDPRLR